MEATSAPVANIRDKYVAVWASILAYRHLRGQGQVAAARSWVTCDKAMVTWWLSGTDTLNCPARPGSKAPEVLV